MVSEITDYADEPHPGIAPCPHCFESSGYAEYVVTATYWEPSYAEYDRSRPCPYCHATGYVEAEARTLADIEEEDAALRAALSHGGGNGSSRTGGKA